MIVQNARVSRCSNYKTVDNPRCIVLRDNVGMQGALGASRTRTTNTADRKGRHGISGQPGGSAQNPSPMRFLAAWADYHAGAPPDPACVGNIWDNPWQPRSHPGAWAAAYAAFLAAGHSAFNGPWWGPVRPTAAVYAQFSMFYAVSVAYVNMVVSNRPHPFRGNVPFPACRRSGMTRLCVPRPPRQLL